MAVMDSCCVLLELLLKSETIVTVVGSGDRIRAFTRDEDPKFSLSYYLGRGWKMAVCKSGRRPLPKPQPC
jgi:hypothetical protein